MPQIHNLGKKSPFILLLLSFILSNKGCLGNEDNPQLLYLEGEPDGTLIVDRSPAVDYTLENEDGSYFDNDSWSPEISQEFMKRAPTQFLKRSASYAKNSDVPEFAIRSPTSYLKRSPTTFMKRSPTTFVKRAHTTFMKRAPTTFMKKSPTVFIKKSPTTFMKRAPTMFV